MRDYLTRTEMVIGRQSIDKLAAAKVLLFGLGGVGGQAAEALARSGIGRLDLVDHDKIEISDLNRQVLATRQTLGQYKVDAARARISAISSDIEVGCFPVFYLPDKADDFVFAEYDYILDCIDTVTAKLAIIAKAQREGTPVLSCLGCGNRLDPARLTVTDIYHTDRDPLAKVMRIQSRKAGLLPYKVICSEETPVKAGLAEGSRHLPGSTAFVPPAAGILAASVICHDIINA